MSKLKIPISKHRYKKYKYKMNDDGKYDDEDDCKDKDIIDLMNFPCGNDEEYNQKFRSISNCTNKPDSWDGSLNLANGTRKRRCDREASGQPIKKDDVITINVIYVRHMYSCANYSKYEKGSILFPFMSDPPLHCKGIKQADDLGEDMASEENLTIDLICTSQLLRAIQTGILIRKKLQEKYRLKDSKIQILPYINEAGIMPDNTPEKYKSFSDQQKDEHKITIMDQYNKDKTNFSLFESEIIPNIKNILLKKNSEKKEFNVIVVSHSNFLKNSFTGSDKLNNGQMIVKKYRFFENEREPEIDGDVYLNKMGDDKSWFNLNWRDWSPYNKKNNPEYIDCEICDDTDLDNQLNMDHGIGNTLCDSSEDVRCDYWKQQYKDKTKNKNLVDNETFDTYQFEKKINIVWVSSGKKCQTKQELHCDGVQEMKDLGEDLKEIRNIDWIYTTNDTTSLESAQILVDTLQTSQSYNYMRREHIRNIEDRVPLEVSDEFYKELEDDYKSNVSHNNIFDKNIKQIDRDVIEGGTPFVKDDIDKENLYKDLIIFFSNHPTLYYAQSFATVIRALIDNNIGIEFFYQAYYKMWVYTVPIFASFEKIFSNMLLSISRSSDKNVYDILSFMGKDQITNVLSSRLVFTFLVHKSDSNPTERLENEKSADYKKRKLVGLNKLFKYLTQNTPNTIIYYIIAGLIKFLPFVDKDDETLNLNTFFRNIGEQLTDDSVVDELIGETEKLKRKYPFSSLTFHDKILLDNTGYEYETNEEFFIKRRLPAMLKNDIYNYELNTGMASEKYEYTFIIVCDPSFLQKTFNTSDKVVRQTYGYIPDRPTKQREIILPNPIYTIYPRLEWSLHQEPRITYKVCKKCDSSFTVPNPEKLFGDPVNIKPFDRMFDLTINVLFLKTATSVDSIDSNILLDTPLLRSIYNSNIQIDLIGSSNRYECMLTAIMIRPGDKGKIVTLPYLNDENNRAVKEFKDIYNFNDGDSYVDWSFFEEKKYSPQLDYLKFGEEIIPKIRDRLSVQDQKKEFNIIIVVNDDFFEGVMQRSYQDFHGFLRRYHFTDRYSDKPVREINGDFTYTIYNDLMMIS